MRIAVLNHGIFPQMVGGMERHTHFLAAHMAAAGAEVEVLIPDLPSEFSQADRASDRRYRLVQFPWPKARLWLRQNYLFSRLAAAYVHQRQLDAVYCQGFNGWAYLESPKRDRGALTVFNPHGLEMFKTIGAEQTVKSYPMRWAARRQAQLADRVVSLGGRLTYETVRFLRIAPERIDVLPNAVDLDYIDRFSALKPHSGEVQFVFVGRLEANKGVDRLCEAFAELKGGRLTVVGSGVLEADLKQRFAGPRVTFAGRLSDQDLFSLYRRSDCFVFSSLYEGMPTVILEAMACGLPVVATDIGAVATMVDRENGFLVQPGSSRELASAMQRFLALPLDARRRMGKASRRKVEEQFVWPVVAQRTLEIIGEHLEIKRKAGLGTPH